MLNSLLNEEFRKCLERFPELKDVGLMVEECEELAGVEGRIGDRRVIVLFVPKSLKDKPEYLIPIIYHELSHMINKENPGKVFFERADENSKCFWRLHQLSKTVNCQIER